MTDADRERWTRLVLEEIRKRPGVLLTRREHDLASRYARDAGRLGTWHTGRQSTWGWAWMDASGGMLMRWSAVK